MMSNTRRRRQRTKQGDARCRTRTTTSMDTWTTETRTRTTAGQQQTRKQHTLNTHQPLGDGSVQGNVYLGNPNSLSLLSLLYALSVSLFFMLYCAISFDVGYGWTWSRRANQTRPNTKLRVFRYDPTFSQETKQKKSYLSECSSSQCWSIARVARVKVLGMLHTFKHTPSRMYSN